MHRGRRERTPLPAFRHFEAAWLLLPRVLRTTHAIEYFDELSRTTAVQSLHGRSLSACRPPGHGEEARRRRMRGDRVALAVRRTDHSGNDRQDPPDGPAGSA